MNNTTKIEFLSPGQTFEISALKTTTRNGVFLFTSPTSSRVILDVCDENGNWKNSQREYLANSVAVTITGEVELQRAPDGTMQVAGTLDESGEIIKIRRERTKRKKIAGVEDAEEIIEENQKDESVPPKTRGRKKSERIIVFPPKGEWTVAQVAESNGVEKYTVANEMTKLKAAGEKFTITKQVPNAGGRGKKINFYKIG